METDLSSAMTSANTPFSPHDTYTSPLSTRNASPEMCRIWSPRHKFQTWRRIWLAVAEAQYEVTKDWGKEETKRAPRVSEGASSHASKAQEGPPAHAGGSSRGPLVTLEQIEELRANLEVTDEDLALAAKYEAELRHDVMAHVHAWGDRCRKARPIIHLGMTSQDVVCNADLALLDASFQQIILKAVRCVIDLAASGQEWLTLPTLAFTHYQAAQPTTVGRRIAQWAADLQLTMAHLPDRREQLTKRIRGLRGATGTQASFLNLLGDGKFVDQAEARLIPALQEWAYQPDWSDEAMEQKQENSRKYLEIELSRMTQHHTPGGPKAAQNAIDRLNARTLDDERATMSAGLLRDHTFPLVSQTYPRVLDAMVLADLASIAAVLHKIATDIRLLSNRKEIDEPFGKNQIGSSAMPYKRNPMKCERICGLTRFVMNLVGNAYDTAATQWLERTLDDSSNRRLSLPESFLALDGALDLMHQVASGLVVNEAMVRKNLMAELPFLATENIMMEAVKLGGDRQDLHEKIRVHAQAAGHRVKQEGLDNDLIERLRSDPAFASVHHLLTEDQLLDPMKYIGRSVEQTERFLREVVEPLRERYGEELDTLGSSDRGV